MGGQGAPRQTHALSSVCPWRAAPSWPLAASVEQQGQVVILSPSHSVWAEAPHRSRLGQLTPPAFRPGPAPCARLREGRRGVSSRCAHEQERAGGFQTLCAPQGRQGVLLLECVWGGGAFLFLPVPPPPSQGLTCCFSAPSQTLNSGAGPQTCCDLYTR